MTNAMIFWYTVTFLVLEAAAALAATGESAATADMTMQPFKLLLQQADTDQLNL